LDRVDLVELWWSAFQKGWKVGATIGSMVREFFGVLLACGIGVLCLIPGQLTADTRVADSDSPQFWRQRLESPLFGERQQASRMLIHLGSRALPYVEEAATSEDPEVRARALAILEHHFRYGHEPIKQAVREILQRLVQSAGPVARAAQLVLNPPPPSSPQDIQQRLFALQLAQLGQLQVQGAAVQGVIVQGAFANQGVNRSATIQEANGRTVRLWQNGQQIRMEWTEPQPQGQPVTKRAEAASLDELKNKHPEAYQVYKQYAPRVGFPLAK
jgi:hypothetical protein